MFHLKRNETSISTSIDEEDEERRRRQKNEK
jgi:hypothetical protein